MIQLHCEQAHPCEVAVSTHLSHLAISSPRRGPNCGASRLCKRRRDYDSPTLNLPVIEYGGNWILFVKRNEEPVSLLSFFLLLKSFTDPGTAWKVASAHLS